MISSRTFTSCLKKSLKKSNSILNNRTSIFPASQAFLRQATTSSILDSRPLFSETFTTDIDLVKFTSPEGKRLFRNAMIQGHAESFFKLMGNFSTQSSPTHGGVSSLAMVLNALEIDPKRIWKGNWRWFSSDQMKTCSSNESIQEYGIPFDEFTCLSQYYCHVEPYRATDYNSFRRRLESVTSDTKNQMVVHYSRKALGQPDSLAHFSPIGGYNKEEDQVLIMDVARGKYPSVWVKTKALYHAMQTLSVEESGRTRGYFVLSNTEENKPSVSLKLKCKDCTRQCHSK
ncbi:Phytochelatin synthase-domain-containing protein [Sporodiniella umbellata]|nr:Phytochelatin synthase-domain-containing protein [Sporodiniella umbellata]